MTLLIVLLTAGYTAWGQGFELIVSKRVGREVDSAEATYFGLFSREAGLRSARFRQGRGDSVEIVLATAGGGGRSIAITGDVYRALGTYIDRYEAIFLHDTTMDLAPLAGLVRPRKPFSDAEDRLFIATRDGSEMAVHLLFVTDSFLLVSSDPVEYIRSRDPSQAWVVRPSDIKRIRDGLGFVHFELRNLDVPVEGNDTLYREKVLGVIRNRVYYHDGLPPEASLLIDEWSQATKDSIEPPTAMADIYEGLKPIGLHFGLAFSTNVTPPSGNHADVERVDQPRVSRDIFIPRDGWMAIYGEYDPVRWARLGINYASFPYPAIPYGKAADYDRLSGSQIGFDVKLVAPRRLLMGEWFGRFEAYAGVGLAYHAVEVESVLASSLRTIPNTKQYTGVFYQDTSVMARTGMIGIAFYPLAALSIGIEARMTEIDDIHVDEQVRLRDIGIYGGIYMLDTHYTHTISQKYLDLLFTSRVNF